MSTRIALALALVAGAATTSYAQLGTSPAPPEQLNGNRHALAFDLGTGWIAVGAARAIGVPQMLGGGHGPFYLVYPDDATLAAHAPAGVTLSAIQPGGFTVRCDRAGVFALDVAVTPKRGAAIHDTATIGCAVPTRFEVESEHGTLLAGASSVSAVFSWFGKTPTGEETALDGVLPVSLRAGETAISLELDGGTATVHALHPANAPVLRSAGLEATLPVVIVDAKPTLELDFTDENVGHPVLDRAKVSRVWTKIRVLDEHGQPFAGIGETGCTLTSTLDGATTNRGAWCGRPIIRKGHLRDRPYPQGEWTADRVCATVLDQTVCKAVP